MTVLKDYVCPVCGDRLSPEAENHDWEGCCSETCSEHLEFVQQFCDRPRECERDEYGDYPEKCSECPFLS